MLIPKDPEDAKNCTMEIRGGTGGDEAAIFAGDLFDMYRRYCEIKGFQLEVIDESPGSMGDIVETTAEKWHEVMNLNLDSCFYMCRAAIVQFRRQGGGAIVNVASISGMLGLSVAHTYTAAKGAMINLTRSLAVTYPMENIRANCIAPGYIATPMVAAVLNMFDDPVVADRLAPMQRPGTPEEMAYGCLYLGSDEASYCNGTVLVIDGGTSARQ